MKKKIYDEISFILDDKGSIYMYGKNNGKQTFETIYNELGEINPSIKIDGKNFVADCNKLTNKDIRNKYFGRVNAYFIFNVDSILNDKKALDYLFELVENEDCFFIMLGTNSLLDYNEDVWSGLSFLDEICVD